MPKETKLSEFEQGKIVALHKERYSMNAVATKVGRSRDVIRRFLKDTVAYNINKRLGQKKKDLFNLPSNRIYLISLNFMGSSRLNIEVAVQ